MQSILDAGLSLESDATFSVLSRERNRAEIMNASPVQWKSVAERVTTGASSAYHARLPENSYNDGKLLLRAFTPARTRPAFAKK